MLFAGTGIGADSDPAAEWAEVSQTNEPLVAALNGEPILAELATEACVPADVIRPSCS